MSRHYRIVHELDNNVGAPGSRPPCRTADVYIVQGDGDHRSQWADVARFPNPDEAHAYITDVLRRHRAIEEHERENA